MLEYQWPRSVLMLTPRSYQSWVSIMYNIMLAMPFTCIVLTPGRENTTVPACVSLSWCMAQSCEINCQTHRGACFLALIHLYTCTIYTQCHACMVYNMSYICDNRLPRRKTVVSEQNGFPQFETISGSFVLNVVGIHNTSWWDYHCVHLHVHIRYSCKEGRDFLFSLLFSLCITGAMG